MSSISHDPSRIEALITRIEHLTGQTISFSARTLESGPAENTGITGLLLTISFNRTIALFSSPGEAGNSDIEDLLAHTRSADAAAMILLTSEEEWYYLDRSEGAKDWASAICIRLAEESIGTVRLFPYPNTIDLSRTVARYLQDLRKDLSGWLYHRDGETGTSQRELTIQLLINQVLLERIMRSHRQESGTLGSPTLWSAISHFVGTAPAQDPYDLTIPVPDNETLAQVQTLASKNQASLSAIRLSWIEPTRWPEIFSRYLASVPKKPSRKSTSSELTECGQTIPARESLVGEEIARVMASEFLTRTPDTFCDPSAGWGDMVTLVLKLFRASMQAQKMPDTIISRLILAGETVHAVEHSPVRTAGIRFAVMIWVLGGQLRDPSLFGTSLWYPLWALIRHIRTGSLLYDEGVTDEFVSSQTDFASLRYLHPLSPADVSTNNQPFSFIISSPDENVPGSIPQTRSFLTRRYTSYQTGISQGALLSERCATLIRSDGISVIFLRSCWLSEAGFQGFRRWISRTLPATIVIPESATGRIDHKEISAVISRKGSGKSLRVSRLSGKSGEALVREYFLDSTDLPEEDGWRLDDPWERHLWRELHQGTIPLEEYVFGELYPGDRGWNTDQIGEGWISIYSRDQGLIISHGNLPDADAAVIIPGKDQYLMGILNSPWIQWFFRLIVSRYHAESDDISRFRSLPIPPVDPYSENECSARQAVERSMQRITMLTRLEKSARTWHDQDRIARQIIVAHEELREKTGDLYRISSADREEIRRRDRFLHPESPLTTCFQIF